MRTKICTKCKTDKSVEMFTICRQKKDGLSSWCRECTHLDRKKSYPKRHAKQKQAMSIVYREKKKNEPWYFLYSNSKSRAKVLGVEHSITAEDVKELWTDVCPILGIPLFCAVFESGGARNGKSKPCTNSPTLDRIDPSKGYTKENIMVISYRANMIKNCGSAEEHRRIADFLDSLSTQTP